MPPTERLLPIILLNGEHAMAKALIEEEPTRTLVSFVVEGPHARYIAELLTTTEPIALSFAGIPVQNHVKEN
jgi:hypothetical protein